MRKRRRIISLLLSVVLLMCMVIPVNAASVDESMNGSSVSADVQPRSFYREYTKYCTTSSSQVMADDNWWGENSLVISMVSNSGPTEVYVTVIDSTTRPIGGGYVTLNSALSLNIPGGPFAVLAMRTAGTNGNVTFGVSLQ